MSRFKVIDVPGDGSCFYRSLYVALSAKRKHLEYINTLLAIDPSKPSEPFKDYTQDEFVLQYRKLLANVIRRGRDSKITSQVYKQFKQLDTEDYALVIKSSFPRWFQSRFKTMPSTSKDFKTSFAEGVTYMSHWASEIEVRITQYILRDRIGMELQVLNHLPAANDFKPKPKTLYVINRDEIHYNALVVSAKAKTSKPKPQPKIKQCDAQKILNPKSNRCVLKTSCTGLRVIYDMHNSRASRSRRRMHNDM